MSIFDRNHKGWTTGDVKRLRELWEQGFTSYEIAKAMGRSRNSICSAARRYELPYRANIINAKPDLITQRQHEAARREYIDSIARASVRVVVS